MARVSLGYCSCPPLQTEEEKDALIQTTEKETGFVHRKQQLILPLRTDAQPQAVLLCHQAERQQRIQAYLDMPNIKVTWLLPRTTQHLLDVSQCVAFREVIGMALPEHVSHSTAGNDLQAATAHPYSERELWKRPQESYSCRQIRQHFQEGQLHQGVSKPYPSTLDVLPVTAKPGKAMPW